MGTSNIKKLKKEKKLKAVSGIERLITLFETHYPEYDTTGLKKILKVSKYIKSGDWGGFRNGLLMWEVSDDFSSFKRYSEELIIKYKYHSKYPDHVDNLIQRIDGTVKRIESKYQVEIRDSVLSSLLDD